ncbi:MAG: family 43 glycosylhydrolase, partial [Acidimicrobiales bacterium]
MFELVPHVAPPAGAGDFADPFILVTGAQYVAFATNLPGKANVQVRTSDDLRTWENAPDALPALPRWAQMGNTWSPAAIERNGTFALWYVCREPQLGRQAISVAVADKPAGPYVDTSVAPAIYQVTEGGSIDPSPFVAPDGQPYLLWKCDANALDKPSS